MDYSKQLELLFQSAATYHFRQFDQVFAQLEERYTPKQMTEAYLMRAQVKFASLDITVIDDLRKVEKADTLIRFPHLGTIWMRNTPNSLIVFSKEPGMFQRFLQHIPEIEAAMRRWYDEDGSHMVRQMQSEILYYQGDLVQALQISEALCSSLSNAPIQIMMARFIQFCCYLAMGVFEKAEEAMLEMVRMSKVHSECLAVYRSIRIWTNLTTGWCGETPRFSDNESGEKVPFIEDRLAGIRNGISRLGPLSAPFAEYAQNHYKDAYTMCQHYMDIFNAFYWFQVGDNKMMEEFFQKACQVSFASNITMPYVEYGAQIVSLLQWWMKREDEPFIKWFTPVVSSAEKYEKSLVLYRT